MIIDLKENSGLGLRFDVDKLQMSFEPDLKPAQPAIRTLEQMRQVLLDKDIQEPKELYYMYRDVHRVCDQPVLERHKLRYDVTVIKPSCLGREFMKTAGHYHPQDYGELYELVWGRCFCFLQRLDPQDQRVIQEVILVEAAAGQKIVIPPGFGHILINPGPDYLITSNWVSSSFASRYELYKQAEGAAYFITNSETAGSLTPRFKIKSEISRNPNFSRVADISFVRPARQINRFGLVEGKPMYNIINDNPNALDFLNRPLDYEYADIFLK